MAAAVRRFIPLFDRVLIEKALAETKSKGGIVIPEKAQTKVLQGTVVAVGPGARTEKGNTLPMSVSVGEKVVLPEYGGIQIKLENKELYLYRDADILGKIPA